MTAIALPVDVQVQRMRRQEISAVAEMTAHNLPEFADYEHTREIVWRNFSLGFNKQYFLAKSEDGEVVAYILWAEKGDRQRKVTFELEQIVVREDLRRRGIGRSLVLRSLHHIKNELDDREEGKGATLRSVEIILPENHSAQPFFEEVLDAQIDGVACLSRGEKKVVMIAWFIPARKGE